MLLEHLAAYLPSTLTTVDIPELLKTSLNSLSERKAAVQSALTQVINERRVLKVSARQRKFALVALENATSYEDWARAALELDNIDGLNTWKEDPVSPAYDHKLLQKRLKQLHDARTAGDLTRVMFLLRISVSRNFAHTGNPQLYSHTNIGTKHVVEEYISEVQEALQFLLRVESPLVSDSQKLDQLTCLRQAYGRTALLLSGGGTLGMNHVGVLAALMERNMLPRIISGTSAGSIVAGVCCTRTDDELPQLLNDFIHGDLNVFQDSTNPETVYDHIARLLKIGVWSDISYLTRVMQDILGDLTFQEAYNRTRRILNITVSSASVYELPRLLNYLTAPNVLIWSAIAASCSVPFIFSSSEILAKDPKSGHPQPWNASPQRWIDGSVDNDLPMAKLSELFNVNHFIVSQVNPHIVPFLEKSSSVRKSFHNSGKAETQESANRPDGGFNGTALSLAVGEIMHRMHMMSELGIFPVLCTKVQSMLSQRYSGDITIVPDISYTDYPALMSNPTPEFLIEARLRGERATWPKLSIIHNHCAIELAIDNALYAMNVKMVFGKTPTSLHHLRHRSHEPQANERFWEGDPRKKPILPPPSSTSETETSHPSISMEITPMDVETPNVSPDSSRLRFFPSMLAKHRSTPTTPAEEARYRSRLLDSGPGNDDLPLDWKGLAFTVLEPSPDHSEDQIEATSVSPTLQRYSSGSAMLGDGISDEGTRLALTITPPSTPSFTTPSLGSPTLTYSGRGPIKDASGTRRMMLKRKSSSFLRLNSSSASQTSQSAGDNGFRSLHNAKS